MYVIIDTNTFANIKDPCIGMNWCPYVNKPCVTPVNYFHTPVVYLHAVDPNVHDWQLPPNPTYICKSDIDELLQHRAHGKKILTVSIQCITGA